MAESQRGNWRADHKLQRPIIALPCRAAELLSLQNDAGWLKSATIRSLPPAVPLLDRLLAELGEPAATVGRAALRLWGQTGHCPNGWVAAADPVWMQAGLKNLCLHVPPAADIEPAALRDLCRDLQQALLSDRGLTLDTQGVSAYLRGACPLPVAVLPATSIDRADPAGFMPAFGDAAVAEYYALASELEMSLFAHPYNVLRESRGQKPLNALWLWGGGAVSGTEPRALPVLFTDDALLRGFAAYSESRCADWPGTLRECFAMTEGNFIAAPSELQAHQLPVLLAELRELWRKRKIHRVLILFDDIACDLTRSWRRLFNFGVRKELEKILNEQ